jgi:hypothetical protein
LGLFGIADFSCPPAISPGEGPPRALCYNQAPHHGSKQNLDNFPRLFGWIAMTDERQKLQATIDALHQELADLDEVDEEAQQLLKSAVADIQAKLDQPSAEEASETDEASSIVGRLGAAARHYEDSHPTLSGIIGSMIDALSRMGI